MAFRVLPRALEPTGVLGLAEALAQGVRDPEFQVLLRRIDASPIYRGNAVTVFFDGPPAFASMCAAIAGAEREVLLEAYILKDDATGRDFVEALAAAVRRGVTVRVLADAFGSSDTRPRFWRQMEERHIEVRLYHPLLPFLWYQPYRDHRKILAVDRRVAFTGGMNIGDEYGSSLKGRGSRTWRDTHARFEGPAAWEMAVVFQEGWDRAGGTPFEIPPLELPPPDEPVPGASILVLDSGPGRGHEETASVLAAMSAAATAFESWRDSTPSARQLALLRIADAIESRAEEFVKVESSNTGKPYGLTTSEEIPPCVDHMRFFSGAARMLEGKAADLLDDEGLRKAYLGR